MMPSTSNSRATNSSKRVCGALTATGTRCRQTILPCARHTPGLKRQPKSSARKKLLIAGVIQGKSVAQAARDAGYSPSSNKTTVYRLIRSADAQEQIRARRKASETSAQEI